MKNKIFILILLIFNISIGKSQTDEKKSGFYDFKISYIYSSKGGLGSYNNHEQIKIPYGLGLSCTFKIYKRFYSEFGLAYKTEVENKEKGYFKISNGPDINFYHKYTYSYVDLPLQFHFNFLKWKSISLFTSAGLKGTMFLYHDYWNPYSDGIEHDERLKEFGIAYYFGLAEYFDITKRFGIFVSQNYGRFFKYYQRNNYYRNDFIEVAQSIDFKIGVSYKIK